MRRGGLFVSETNQDRIIVGSGVCLCEEVRSAGDLVGGEGNVKQPVAKPKDNFIGRFGSKEGEVRLYQPCNLT